jgi:hypothetical protein
MTTTFIAGQSYKLEAKKKQCATHTYDAMNTLYVGSYDSNGKLSHCFVHVLAEPSLLEFVMVWVHLASNRILEGKVDTNLLVYSDIFDDKFENGWVTAEKQ